MLRGYANTESGQIHYYSDGQTGPLVFLLHETALAANEFEKTIPYLAAKTRPIALDTPGYGMSDAPASPLSMEEIAAWLHKAIEQFGDGPCILAGAHTGASIALELATNQMKERVTHLILTGANLLTADQVQGIRRIMEKNELDPEGRFLTDLWTKQRNRWGKDTEINALFWGAMEHLRVFKRANWALEAVLDYDTESAMRKVNCPTYFLVGERDSLVDSDKRAVNIIRNSKIEVLAGGPGRLPYFEPKIYAEKILAFAGL